MKILLAVDSRAGHAFTVFHAVPPVPHRAAAFAGPDLVHGYYEDDARAVLEPVRFLLVR